MVEKSSFGDGRKDFVNPFETTALRFDGKRLFALDQRELPHREDWIDITDSENAVLAIRALAVRGAPLIGVAAAACLGCHFENSSRGSDFESSAQALKNARPTAVNLGWAVDRILSAWRNGANVVAVAEAILNGDRETCDQIASFGATLISDGDSILTHCNAGALATAGKGTALGIIKEAHSQGKAIHVFVDETRPLLQGGRLTVWELKRSGIPYTLICDNMAGYLMSKGRINVAVVGADRIARNGDVANKIGTYSVAVQSHFHGIGFVVAAPFSTVDLNCATGNEIPIEMREPSEIRPGEPCFNPAFDVTPRELVSRYVLETGSYAGQDLMRYLQDRVRENRS